MLIGPMFSRGGLRYPEEKEGGVMSMYELKNGILCHDGQAEIGLGVSYFASFHPEKWPVAADDDRIGQMRLDIREIAEFGFNHIRCAAFEQLWWDQDEIKFDFPFIDAMLTETAKNGLAAIVRLHGYSMNHRNHPDNQLVNERGESSDLLSQSFVHDCLSNQAVMADARQATRTLACHFAGFTDVIGFQIYNEPAYPWSGGVYDYSPCTIAAYRTWLVDHGHQSAAAARTYEPPRRVPVCGEDPTEWIRFRRFNTDRMTAMLIDLNDAARQAVPGLESMSNLMSCPLKPKQSHMGEDFFPVARGMDYLGYDAYSPFRGQAYYAADAVLSGVESAAAAAGKHAWVIEFCCRTHMTIEDLELETVSALGRGFKGINYYAWRSDVIGPEGGLGGIIRADRSRTPKYEEMEILLRLIRPLSGKFARAERLRDGVAILYSHQATILSDALDEVPQTQDAMTRIYTDLKYLGITADYLSADDLAADPFTTRLLIVPQLSRLSEHEAQAVTAFAQTRPVFCFEPAGYRVHPACAADNLNGQERLPDWCFRPRDPKVWYYRACEILELCAVKPALHLAGCGSDLGFGYVQGHDKAYVLACLNNIRSDKKPVAGGSLFFSEPLLGVIRQAVIYMRHNTRELPIRRDGAVAWVDLPAIPAGAIVCLAR
jgi:hypothetical protein